MTTSPNFISSLSTIPCNVKTHHQQFSTLRYNKCQFLKIPTQQMYPKFPKHSLRKQTKVNMYTQSNQNPQRKSCIRNFSYANCSSVCEISHVNRPLSNPGIFHGLANQSNTIMPTTRTLEDFGAVRNRKKFMQALHVRLDPILVGHLQTQNNSAYSKQWTEPRKHRDNGKSCSQALLWTTPKNKKSYLQRYRQKNNHERLQSTKLSNH